uniref:Uncharacterized protein n=1 Tax=Ascaris lumbricoides TaxID=6252 RepID=A0A9J2P3L2_ASCLU
MHASTSAVAFEFSLPLQRCECNRFPTLASCEISHTKTRSFLKTVRNNRIEFRRIISLGKSADRLSTGNSSGRAKNNSS